MSDKKQNDQLGAFADIADLLEEEQESESIWDKDRQNNFEYQDFLEKEEKRLKKLDQLFTHKYENYEQNARPEVIYQEARQQADLQQRKVIKELLSMNSSIHGEIRQMWHSLFERV